MTDRLPHPTSFEKMLHPLKQDRHQCVAILCTRNDTRLLRFFQILVGFASLSPAAVTPAHIMMPMQTFAYDCYKQNFRKILH